MADGTPLPLAHAARALPCLAGEGRERIGDREIAPWLAVGRRRRRALEIGKMGWHYAPPCVATTSKELPHLYRRRGREGKEGRHMRRGPTTAIGRGLATTVGERGRPCSRKQRRDRGVV
jgi:hypothetical protein